MGDPTDPRSDRSLLRLWFGECVIRPGLCHYPILPRSVVLTALHHAKQLSWWYDWNKNAGVDFFSDAGTVNIDAEFMPMV